jgi:carbamoyl-phosphate synthase large subunit
MVFISVKDEDKAQAVQIAQRLAAIGYEVCATHGTAELIAKTGVKVKGVNKVREGRPHIVDMLKNREVQLVINTTDGAEAIADSFSIRATSLTAKIPYTTTLSGALAIASALEAMSKEEIQVYPLQSYA